MVSGAIEASPAGWQVSFAAWLLAAFCVATAVLYHPFWPDALRADRVRSGQDGRRRAAAERRPLGRGEASVIFSVQPVGWVGDWHENRAPQWIAPLSGRWFVESMNGQRVEMEPGELSLGEDQQCVKDAQGHFGDRSGTLEDEPAHLMIVQLHVDPVGAACHLR